MNTRANTIASKLFVAMVAVAMLFTLVTPAKAATTEELQKMINDLLAQVASLQGQVGQGGTSVASGVCPFTWTRSLKTGMTGADVMKLQQFLNADVETRVAAAGAGSVGQETQYFGPATAAAVSKFQVKYRAEVLTPSGLVNPTGYFGPATMGKANTLCTTAPTTPDNGGTTGSTTTSTDLKGGEASIDNDFKVTDGDDVDLEEGQKNAPVMDVSFNVKDGDVSIDRIDVAVRADSSNDERDPWDTFDNVSIWVDGEKVADMDTDSKSDWSKKSSGSDTYYTVRLTGLNWVVREGDKAEFTVGVTTNNSIKGSTRDWEIFVPTDGVRANDSLKIQHYAGDNDKTVDFNINDLGGDDEITVRESDSNPSATTLELEDNARSNWMTVLGFNLDTDDSVNDIQLNSLRVTVDTEDSASNATTTSRLVNKVRLMIDGKTYTDYTVVSSTTGSAVYEFDLEDEDVVIDAGDEVDAEFQVEFKQLESTLEGATIRATVDSADIEAEGGDDLTSSQLKGSATGDLHTLRSSGLALMLKDSTASAVVVDGNNNDYGNYTMTVDITAFGEDVYVPLTAARGTSGAGVAYTIETANDGNTATTGTAVASVSRVSGGTVSGNYVKISEGSTATLKLNVAYTPATSGSYRVQLESITTDSNGATSGGTISVQDATPEADFQSDTALIVN